MNNNLTTLNNNSSTLLLDCLKPQYFNSLSEFLKCYILLYQYNWAKATAGILLAVLAVFFNTLVIILLVRMPHKKNVFEKILIAHCIINGVTGLVDVPFFHINDLFGYWPLGMLGAYLWSSYDNSINVITNLTMLYITWLRFRSITAPNTYKKELIAKQPELICLIIWLIGLLIWIPVTTKYGLNDFSLNLNSSNQVFQTLMIFFTWFVPLSSIIILSIAIIIILHKRIRIKGLLQAKAIIKKFQKNNNSQISIIITKNTSLRIGRRDSIPIVRYRYFHFGPQLRFMIIIISYCLQWFPSSLIAIIEPLCYCVPLNVSGTIYWLTYTVCLTDPLVILLFNLNLVRISPH